MAQSPGKIKDVGEKIGRAAKDTRGLRLTQAAIDAMTPIEKAKRITKSNIWPEPDYRELVKNGMDGKAAFVLKKIYDGLASKPALRWARSSPESQMAVIDAYSSILLNVSQAAEAGKTVQDMLKLSQVAMRVVRGPVPKERLSVEETEAKRSVNRAKYKNPFEPGRYELAMADVFGATLGEDVPDWKQGIAIREASKEPGKYFFQSFFDNNDHLMVMAVDPATGKPRPGVDAITAKTTSGYRTKTDRYFDSKEEAWETIKSVYDARNKGVESTIEKKERKKAEGPITRAKLEILERIGPKTRTGDVSATELMTEFGFRGIEFGEWVPDKERRMIVNMAWDAFCDLAEVLQIEHKEIGLGGLALGFGSRGKSSASAHYEPDLHVFNLTRMNGAGSMAHEYGHALDHYVFERAHGLKVVNRKAVMASDRSKSMPLPPAEQSVWNETVSSLFRKPRPTASHNSMIMRSDSHLVSQEQRARMAADPEYRLPCPPGWPEWNKTVRTDYAAEAAKSSKSDYYLSSAEMYARAFESWVHDTLKDMGRKSDYLVNSVDEMYAELLGMPFNPYPTGEERVVIGGLIKDTVVSGLSKQRIMALENGVTTERERRHRQWVNGKESVEPVAPAPAPAPVPAPVVEPEDYRIDKTKPVTMTVWHAFAVDAALSVLVRDKGHGDPRFALSDADREAAVGYVKHAMPEVVSGDQATEEMREKAVDTVCAMMMLDRLDISETVRSEAIEAVKSSGSGEIAAAWVDPEHAEAAFRFKETMTTIEQAPPPAPEKPFPKPAQTTPVQQAFLF